jgi:acetyl esterase/lipase
MTTPIDETDPLVPTDPLEVHGMKAGTTANDHGPFRAAATVRPADLTDSSLLRVPDGDVVRCRTPWPEMVHGVPFGDGLHADVLVPRGDGPFPVVVFVPGGGFVLSPRSAALVRRTAIAERGFVVVSIEYRTLRRGTATDGVADVAAAVDWARTHAAEYGGDPGRVALWGESAGGYLSALAVTSGSVDGLRCVVDTFGLTDLSKVAMDFDAGEQARHLTPEITEAQYVFGRDSGMTILDDPDAVQRVNPVRHVHGGEPPFLFFHGEIDGLVSPGQSQLLHQALLAAGVDSTRYVVAGAGHYGLEWSSTTVLSLIGEFLARHLGEPFGGGS